MSATHPSGPAAGEPDMRLRETQQRLALALLAARLGVFEYDPRSGRIIWDERTGDFWGVPVDEPVTFAVFEAGLIAADREPTRAALTRAFDPAGNGRYEVEYRVRNRLTGAVRWLRAVGDTRFEGGQAVALFGTVADITDARQAREMLESREARLSRILDGALAFIGLLDTDGTVCEANAPALAAGGLTSADVVGRKFWDCYWWSHSIAEQERLRQAVAAAAAGEIIRYDAEVRMADDSRMTIDFMLSPVRDADGKVELLVPSGIDISERKASEERINLLMREVTHRSKNMLAVVQAIARQTERTGQEDWRHRFSERISALAAGHDLLVRNDWQPVDLGALFRAQLAHFAGLIDARIHVSGPPVRLGSGAAQALGMTIHELATNAGKYGALSNDAGTVAINWTLQPSAGTEYAHIGGETLIVRWTERGGPPVVPPSRTGFGSSVIDVMTRRAVNGVVDVAFQPDGLEWQLLCPAAALRQ